MTRKDTKRLIVEEKPKEVVSDGIGFFSENGTELASKKDVQDETLTEKIVDTTSEHVVPTIRTDRIVIKPDRLVENCAIVLTAIQYETLFGIMTCQEYTECEVCVVRHRSNEVFRILRNSKY